GQPDTFEVDPEVLRALKGPALYRVPPSPAPRTLELAGSLSFDLDTLGRVQSRFPGEVVALGKNEEGGYDTKGRSERDRPLRPGEQVRGPQCGRNGQLVKQGQLLAEVWSKDLGEKKSELIEALAQLRLDQESLTRAEELYSGGNTPEAVVRLARRAVSA